MKDYLARYEDLIEQVSGIAPSGEQASKPRNASRPKKIATPKTRAGKLQTA
jgi:hypothetical protein